MCDHPCICAHPPPALPWYPSRPKSPQGSAVRGKQRQVPTLGKRWHGSCYLRTCVCLSSFRQFLYTSQVDMTFWTPWAKERPMFCPAWPEVMGVRMHLALGAPHGCGFLKAVSILWPQEWPCTLGCHRAALHTIHCMCAMVCKVLLPEWFDSSSLSVASHGVALAAGRPRGDWRAHTASQVALKHFLAS